MAGIITLNIKFLKLVLNFLNNDISTVPHFTKLDYQINNISKPISLQVGCEIEWFML